MEGPAVHGVPLVLGVDPGKVTGFFHAALPLTWSEVTQDEVLVTLRDYRDCPGIAAIACEKYVLRPQRRAMTAQPEALQVMGIIEAFAQDHAIPITWCQPGAAKKMVSNQRLKRAGWYVNTPDMHASDAARQALRYVAINRPEVFAQLVRL